ncbi:hypothetical protein POTOM_021474 [Populus tomentosa]|uniref:Uncharacterized protein n=1 Tax=Populus tomentosa TaxID=118781 RepID=A0A8X8D1B0_POPTO|nr:hypothetical protein POTOM_021474 [Populus tomentosa]
MQTMSTNQVYGSTFNGCHSDKSEAKPFLQFISTLTVLSLSLSLSLAAVRFFDLSLKFKNSAAKRVDELVLVKGTTVAIFLGEKHYAVVPESFY